jgi:YVTN family beta-propeller protein
MKHLLALVTFGAFLTLPLAAQSGKVYIVQTNSAGDSVSLIDPTTDKVAAEIPRPRSFTAPRPRRTAATSTSATKPSTPSTSSIPRR